MKYAKGIVAFLIPVGQAVQAAITDSTITGDEWIKIGIAVVFAAGVVAVPNKVAPSPSPQEKRDQLADELDHAPSRVAERRPPRAYRPQAERGGYPSGGTPADKLPPPQTGVKPPDPPS